MHTIIKIAYILIQIRQMCNFHPSEAVGQGSETQRQMCKTLNFTHLKIYFNFIM